MKEPSACRKHACLTGRGNSRRSVNVEDDPCEEASVTTRTDKNVNLLRTLITSH